MMNAILPDLSDPESMMEAAIELFGDEAATAVAHCGLEAWTEGRSDDFGFWVVIFRRLTGVPSPGAGN